MVIFYFKKIGQFFEKKGVYITKYDLKKRIGTKKKIGISMLTTNWNQLDKWENN